MHLAARGIPRVVLLERDALASGPTGKSSAVLRQHYATPVMARLARQSLEVFAHFEEAVGGVSGYVRAGYLVVVDELDRQALQENVALQQAEGVRTHLVDAAGLRALVPGMVTDDLAAGAYEPDGGYADPHLVTHAFAARARAHGAEIRQGVRVRRLLVERGRIAGVSTTAGILRTRSVLLAAGVWGVELADQIGWHLPVRATRHAIAIFRRPATLLRHPVIGDRTTMAYLRPDGDVTLVGSMDPHDNATSVDPDAYPERISTTEMEVAAERLVHRFPAAAEAAALGGYAGIYDMTPDAHPVLDACPVVEGLFIAAGFSGHGFKHSPVMGSLLAALVTEGTRAHPDLAFFASNRFATGRLLAGRHAYRRVPVYQ